MAPQRNTRSRRDMQQLAEVLAVCMAHTSSDIAEEAIYALSCCVDGDSRSTAILQHHAIWLPLLLAAACHEERSTDCQDDALLTLAALGCTPQTIPALLDQPGAVAHLVHGCARQNSTQLPNALRALGNLTITSRGRAAVLEHAGVLLPALASCLQQEDDEEVLAQAADTLKALCETDEGSSTVGPRCDVLMPLLAAHLHHHSTVVVLAASNALCALITSDAACHAALRSPETIKAFLWSLTQRSLPQLAVDASFALSNLARHHAADIVACRQAHSITAALSAAISHVNPDVGSNAAAAFVQLLGVGPAAHAILSHVRAPEALVASLNHGQPSVVSQAAGALEDLACSSASTLQQLLRAGMMPALVACLSSQEQQVAAAVAATISNIARDNAAMMVRTPGVMRALVSCLGHASADVAGGAAAALANLCRTDAGCRVLFRHQAAAPALAAALQHDHPPVVVHSLSTINSLVRRRMWQKPILQHMGAILRCLGHSDPEVTKRAGACLQLLCVDRHGTAQLGAMHAIFAGISCCMRESCEKERAAGLIGSMEEVARNLNEAVSGLAHQQRRGRQQP